MTGLAVRLLRGLIALLAATSLVAAAAQDDAARAELGRAIYEGTLPGFAERVRNARDPNVKLPAAQAGCVNCHRPSGLGGFEGALAVPPIAGNLLFKPYDLATTHRYAWSSRLRVRPAYTQASLHELLRDGRSPDGVPISPVMPRYQFSADELAALATHLRGLSSGMAPGVSSDSVNFATITTPEVSPAQTAELLATLQRFFEHKNANTRGENARRDSALRNEQSMYRRHRTWRLQHWALQGAPETWGAQLDAWYAREPVFAVLSGVGEQTWEPIHAFCAVRRVPCLLPSAALPPQVEDFYSVYLSRGWIGQAEAAARHLSQTQPQLRSVVLLTGESALARQQAQALAAPLAAHGLDVQIAQHWQAGDSVVTALGAAQIAQRRRGPAGGSTLLALAGMAPVSDDADLAAIAGVGWWVTDQLHGAAAERQLQRARAWFRANRVQAGSGAVAHNALLAATVAVESLMHVDEDFSREYCLEKLEHNLENMPALTAYPRLAIGPQQRFAAKQVMLVPMTQLVTSRH
jgi:cytochrome c553